MRTHLVLRNSLALVRPLLKRTWSSSSHSSQYLGKRKRGKKTLTFTYLLGLGLYKMSQQKSQSNGQSLRHRCRFLEKKKKENYKK